MNKKERNIKFKKFRRETFKTKENLEESKKKFIKDLNAEIKMNKDMRKTIRKLRW